MHVAKTFNIDEREMKTLKKDYEKNAQIYTNMRLASSVATTIGEMKRREAAQYKADQKIKLLRKRLGTVKEEDEAVEETPIPKQVKLHKGSLIFRRETQIQTVMKAISVIGHHGGPIQSQLGSEQHILGYFSCKDMLAIINARATIVKQCHYSPDIDDIGKSRICEFNAFLFGKETISCEFVATEEIPVITAFQIFAQTSINKLLVKRPQERTQMAIKDENDLLCMLITDKDLVRYICSPAVMDELKTSDFHLEFLNQPLETLFTEKFLEKNVMQIDASIPLGEALNILEVSRRSAIAVVENVQTFMVKSMKHKNIRGFLAVTDIHYLMSPVTKTLDRISTTLKQPVKNFIHKITRETKRSPLLLHRRTKLIELLEKIENVGRRNHPETHVIFVCESHGDSIDAVIEYSDVIKLITRQLICKNKKPLRVRRLTIPGLLFDDVWRDTDIYDIALRKDEIPVLHVGDLKLDAVKELTRVSGDYIFKGTDRIFSMPPHYNGILVKDGDNTFFMKVIDYRTIVQYVVEAKDILKEWSDGNKLRALTWQDILGNEVIEADVEEFSNIVDMDTILVTEVVYMLRDTHVLIGVSEKKPVSFITFTQVAKSTLESKRFEFMDILGTHFFELAITDMLKPATPLDRKATFFDILELMHQQNLTAVLVIDGEGKPLLTFTIDLVASILLQEEFNNMFSPAEIVYTQFKPGDIQAEEYILSENSSILQALQLMEMNNQEHFYMACEDETYRLLDTGFMMSCIQCNDLGPDILESLKRIGKDTTPFIRGSFVQASKNTLIKMASKFKQKLTRKN